MNGAFLDVSTTMVDTKTLSRTNSTPEISEVHEVLLDKVSTALWTYVPPFTILFGTFGNVMTIVIMRRMTSSDSVINVYFVTLAVVDLIALYTIPFWRWVGMNWGFFVWDSHVVACKVVYWLGFCAPGLSAWTLVCVTLHRAVSVAWPHKVGVFFTHRRVTVLLSVLACIVGLLYSHCFYTMTIVHFPGEDNTLVPACFPASEFFHFISNVFVYVDLAAFSLLPFTFLALGNAFLIRKLTLSVKDAGLTLTSAKAQGQQSAARSKAASSVTLTVVVVSLTYIALTLPYALSYVSAYQGDEYLRLEPAQLRLFKTVVFLLGTTNNAVNFYLYCLTGSRFRKEFLEVVCGSRSCLCPKATPVDPNSLDPDLKTRQSTVSDSSCATAS